MASKAVVEDAASTPSARSRALWPLALALSVVGASSLRVQPQLPGFHFADADKLAHLLYYGLLGTLIFRLFRFRSVVTAVGLAVFATLFVALADEWRQALNPSRQFEFADLAADALGSLIATATYATWPAYRRFLESSVL